MLNHGIITLFTLQCIYVASSASNAAFVIQRSVAHERSKAVCFSIATGIGFGLCALTIIAVCALLGNNSTPGLQIIQFAGIAYFFYAGQKTFRTPSLLSESREQKNTKNVWVTGLLCGICNPGAMVFLTTLVTLDRIPYHNPLALTGSVVGMASIYIVWFSLLAMVIALPRCKHWITKNSSLSCRILGVLIMLRALSLLVYG